MSTSICWENLTTPEILAELKLRRITGPLNLFPTAQLVSIFVQVLHRPYTDNALDIPLLVRHYHSDQ